MIEARVGDDGEIESEEHASAASGCRYAQTDSLCARYGDGSTPATVAYPRSGGAGKRTEAITAHKRSRTYPAARSAGAGLEPLSGCEPLDWLCRLSYGLCYQSGAAQSRSSGSLACYQ